MEILSSLRTSKFLLAILSFVLLANLSSQAARDVLYRVESPPDLVLDRKVEKLTRASFPANFSFGAGSSAMQIEGSAHEGGRGPGVWDERVEQMKGFEWFKDGDKFSTQIEHYKRYKEDVQLLKKLGVNTYRFSISWSRILPDGTLKGGVNKEGILFYNNMINELLANGITPFVTIMHFDYPLALHKKFDGFLNRTIVNHYKDFSKLLFETYGDRVKHWATMNELEVTAIYTYMHGLDKVPPKACETTGICKTPYTFVHNSLLAHATVCQLYKHHFQAKQGGEIGLVISTSYFVPYSSKPEDVAAAQRLLDFFIGWTLEPLFYGDYPKVMRELVGNRLPKFSKKETEMIKGSADFIGINYYTSHYSKHESNRSNAQFSDNYDAMAISVDVDAEGKTIGYKDKYGLSYGNVYSKGLYDVLVYIKDKYQNPNIYITENGIGTNKHPNNLKEMHRIAYFASHLYATKAAIDNGVKVRGYFAWSAFDTFEFQDGYTGNFGLYHIDFNNNLTRVASPAAEWYRKFLTTK